jgi:4-diphosphocytidyl-2-C-methyl-D-erythritol kinase
MSYDKIKSYAKINLALNITGKTNSLHKIESIISFVSLHDEILIKRINSNKHIISFKGKFSKRIGKNNSISKLLDLLEKKKIIKGKKFHIKINKKIPIKSGLGGGSMNAASILKYFIQKKIIKISKKEIIIISNSIGSDVILGLRFINCVLTSKNRIKYFKSYKKIYTLIVKPNFGCSTKDIYSKVRKFDRSILNRPNIRMFDLNFLSKMRNSLEPIAFSKYPKLQAIKSYLEISSKAFFVRMTGSGSALIAYFKSKEKCENAKRQFNKKYKNYWCIVSKTI